MTPDRHILNVTFHCERSALRDVAYFLKHRLLPGWRSRFSEVHLLALPEMQGFAVQISDEDDTRLTDFEPATDPDVLKIMSVYPEMVTFFPTLLSVIE